MPERHVDIWSGAARCVLLCMLAGLLIGRRDFAHLSVVDLPLWTWLHITPPAFASYLFITETTLLALFPLAVREARIQFSNAGSGTARDSFLRAFGWGVCMPLALIAWGLAHAVVAKVSGGETYLIFRQSALALYPIVFVYAFLFFNGSEKQIRFAVGGAIAAALLCAALDSVGWLDPKLDANGRPPYGEWMPMYGQETLSIAILGLIYFIVAARSWLWRDLAILGVCMAGWRQGVRPMQSVVPIGVVSALGLLLVTGVALAFTGQRATLKRIAMVLAIFVVLGGGYKVMRSMSQKPEQPGTETASEVKAWGLGQYAGLFDVFDHAQMPADHAARMTSRRPPFERVDDPEVYKLEAVFKATGSVSVRNNMWRFLVWRRMFSDWRAGHSIVGAGVGRPWFYRALYSSGFHYGDDREGLDPHNSYLNTLYRYGVIGFLLLLSAIVWTIARTFKALRANGGDALLEGLLLYFGYTIAFAFFTVSFEGPAYSMPFWMTMGLLNARSKQVLALRPVSSLPSALH